MRRISLWRLGTVHRCYGFLRIGAERGEPRLIPDFLDVGAAGKKIEKGWVLVVF